MFIYQYSTSFQNSGIQQAVDRWDEQSPGGKSLWRMSRRRILTVWVEC